jgi:hypothetical protein
MQSNFRAKGLVAENSTISRLSGGAQRCGRKKMLNAAAVCPQKPMKLHSF